ncbi:MAG TPA: discoidin domain-containing protein [Actinocrinis sp.]|nr:discoidin domain-containing protein [Actinocrinis sp.]
MRRVVALAGSTTLLAGGMIALAVQPAAAATATGGSGASLPYVEVLAQNSPNTGSVVGPDYLMGQLTQSAVGREAVTLTQGQSVTLTSPVATNSIDLRYSIPDTSDGSTYTAPISLYVNGVQQPDITLTNQYEWQYGSYQFSNTPQSGETMHAFDEVHKLFSQTYPAGSTFKLQVNSEDTASSYTINLADFEDVPAPLTQPSGSVSVTSEGADPTGAADATSAFNAAIAAAGPGGVVWIPPGTYDVPWHITVNDVTLEGAGMWYSTLSGAAPGVFGLGEPNSCGIGGNTGVSSNVHLSNFAIFGQVNSRNDCDQDNGIGGALSNSTVSNIWVEHEKVGAWMDGPMTNLVFSNMRIRDTFADGINFHGGVTNSTVTNSNIRNTGDDGLALWADSSLGADSGDTFSDDTVQSVNFANGMAGYGGNNNTFTGNLVEDSGLIQGGGITVAQRFTTTPVGLYTLSNNTMIRDGQLDPNWQFGVGALWFDGEQGNVTGPINVTNALIEQSPYEAIQWIEGTVSGVNLNNVSIIGTGTFALQEQTEGSATFTNVTATGVAQATGSQGDVPSYNCEGTAFVVTDGGGNSGISPGNCNIGDNPPPVFPPFPPSAVYTTPGTLNFGSLVVGQTSSAQTVSVLNPTGAAVPVSAVAVSGPFTETNNCSSIPAGGSCTANVAFKPTATGAAGGSLTVTAGGVTSTTTLTGTGTPPGPVLSTSPGGLNFASELVGTAAPSQTITVSNTGTTAATVSNVAVTGPYTQTNNCSSIAVGSSCTVTVGFTPTAGGANPGTLTITGNANNSPTTATLSGSGISSTTNLALTGTMTASTTDSGFPATNANDGNTSTYWESSDGTAYPQTLSAKLSQAYPLGSVTLALPPSTAWSTRTQTLSILGSGNGTSWTTVVPSATYTFNPATGNSVSVNLPSGTNYQYLQLSFTGNSGWTAAQLSEFEIFPGSGGGTTPPPPTATLTASPTSVNLGSETVGSTSAAQTVTVSNTGTAAASVSSISAGAPFAETNTCGSSIAAGASCTVSVTFKPTASGAASGSLTVASNATNASLSVALTGTGTTSGGTPSNLALNAPITASSYTQTYVASNANDGNTSTYWEGSDGAWPTTLAVNLGASDSLNSVVLNLPPSTSWGTRTQTLAVLGSANGSSYTNLVPSGVYTFNPSTGNTVTIPLPAGTADQYVELYFTGNSVQNGAQLSEFQVMGTASGTAKPDLALNAATTASSYTQTYVASNTTDGNTNTYWEGTNGAWPTTLSVNLGASKSVGSVVLNLPPSSSWGTRTQTLSVLGSTNGSSYTTLVNSATYTFNPSTGNTVTIQLPAGTTDQYVQLSFTANNVQNGAQLSELSVYGP